jgi:hypothetical protein
MKQRNNVGPDSWRHSVIPRKKEKNLLELQWKYSRMIGESNTAKVSEELRLRSFPT